ncbi:MAG: exopolyphosphatase [Phoenicibacter congonensis]|uniref:Exopolyphosphatase n=1 Tax=Phoenicibacter congonensis TaxID=1944646 RepID=A0AA43RJU0_9ACTN|nr:exopolyphosphatase [Phoenicibacter congonensis]
MKAGLNTKPKTKRIGVIDTGSNTVRLAVFDCDLSDRSKFKEPIDVKAVAGLSNYVQDGIFTQRGVEKASRTLSRHIDRAENLNCDEIYVFATAVLRNASNSEQAVHAIEKRIGHKIDLLSGFDEARLGCQGAFADGDDKEGTLIDLGGGSCEVTCFGETSVFSQSLKLGCISTYSEFVNCLFPTEEECRAIRFAAQDAIRSLNCDLSKTKQLFGIGGSVRAIARLTREMKCLEKTPKHIWATDVQDAVELLESHPDLFAHAAVRAVPERLHSVVPGCLIIGELISACGVEELDIKKGGLREGYLLSKL